MNFYQENHLTYYKSTVNIDPAVFLEPLVRVIATKANLLDIGCGSGRDLRWFAARGYSPTGFEKSPDLARLARQHAACPVIEGDFRDFDFSQLSFSALVLVGSLVHLPHAEFPIILNRLCQALPNGGHILITLKEGSGTSSTADGRIFILWSATELELVFRSRGLEVLNFSRQVSRVRPDDTWLGYVLRLSDRPMFRPGESRHWPDQENFAWHRQERFEKTKNYASGWPEQSRIHPGAMANATFYPSR